MSHISTYSKIFMLLIFFFSIINLLSIILIFIWRLKNRINTDKNSMASCLARLGLVLIVFLFLFSIPIEALVKNDLDKINYPCKDYVYEYKKNIGDEFDDILYGNNNDDILYLDEQNTKFSEEEKKFCEEKKDNNYFTNKCSNNEYLVSYLIPTLIQVITIVLCCLWFSERKRIILKIEGIIERNAEKQIINPQYDMNYPMGYGQGYPNNNVMIYSPYQNNYPIQEQQVIDFRNDGQRRFSQINMNFSRNRNNDCFNYIRNNINQSNDKESVSNFDNSLSKRNSRSDRSEGSVNSGSVTKINGMNSAMTMKKRKGKKKKSKSKKDELFEIKDGSKNNNENNEGEIYGGVNDIYPNNLNASNE